MKKARILVTSGIITVSMTTSMLSMEFIDQTAVDAYSAQQKQRLLEIQEMIRKGITDDTILRDAIGQIRYLGRYPEELTANMRRLVDAAEIPHERVIIVLEDMIRKTLSVIEEDETKIESVGISGVMPLLEAFPDYDILPIVKECLKSKASHVRRNALESYANVEGVKSIPLLREAIAKRGLTDNDRDFLYRRLNKITINLTQENKTNDVEKLRAFVTEMKQAEKPKEEKPPIP